MPAPGKKPVPKAVKAQRGTLQPCRDGVATQQKPPPVEAAMVLTPPELPLDVADVWAEYVQAAVTNGARQCDTEAFAEWCTMAANLRTARNGSPPTTAPASYVAQFRMLGELFGLAGPGSRVVSKSAEAAKSNPFARNGQR